MADTRQKVCSHRNLSVCVGKGDVGIFDGNPRAAQSVYLNHCYSSVVSNYRQWQRQEFLYRGPKNHGSLGGRGNPTPTTLTKSLDLHVYYKWHRSALWGGGPGHRTPHARHRRLQVLCWGTRPPTWSGDSNHHHHHQSKYLEWPK